MKNLIAALWLLISGVACAQFGMGPGPGLGAFQLPTIYSGTVVVVANVGSGGSCSGAGGTSTYLYSSGTANCGSLTPTTDNNGNTIAIVLASGSANTTQLNISSASSLGQSYFTYLTINGVTYNSASVSGYNYTAGYSEWIWSGTIFTAAGTYSMSYR